MFEPGENVVCIDDKFPQWVVALYKELPKKGTTYVVRDIVAGHNIPEGRKNDIAVLLVGMVGHINKLGTENGFGCHRFRRPDEVDVPEKLEKENTEPVLV